MSPSVVETPFFSLYVLWFYSDTLKSVRAKKRVMDVTVTQTVPLPPLDDENIASECDNLNPYFFIYIAASLVTVVLSLYCRHRSVSPPSFVLRKSTPDFGLPFKFAAVMYNVCLWALVPQITLFLVFHVLTTDVFPLQTNCACIVITTVPFMPFVLLVQGTLMLALLPRPNSIRTDVCDVLFPESMTTSTASSSEPLFSTAVVVGAEVKPSKQNKKLEKTLILGCTSHGALLVDALCKEQRAGDVEGYMVDLSGSDSQSAFVHYNADCLGVSDALGARYFRASADNCVLPFADGFFDRVVISPGLRSSDSIGNVLTPENEKLPRMLCVLCEGMRVLRVGGEMCALDDIFTVLRLWADLRDAGFAASITDALAVSQPVLKWKVKLYHLKAFRPASPSLGCNSSASSKSTVGGDREANTRKPGQGLPSPFSPSLSLDEEMLLSHHKETQPNQTISTPATPLFGDTCKAAPTTGVVPTYAQHLVVILGIQSTVFVLLVVGMVAAYEPLSVPSTIPFDVRLGNVVATIVMGYPMIASVFRHFRLSSPMRRYESTVHFLCSCLRSELLPFAITLKAFMMQTVPAFLLQIALRDTSLSGKTCATLGMFASMPLGMTMMLVAKRFHKSHLISSRNIPEEYQTYLN